jgi:hypothetical protein
MLSDSATRGVPDKMGAVDIQSIHEGQQIIRHGAGTVDQGRWAAAANPTVIVQNHPELAAKRLHLVRPECPASSEAGSQQHHITITVAFRIKLCVAN